ncbi:MAG: bifunctional riboflavin kinase/FAD synthetase [Bacteroidales bacterium]|nr:bifunctional riboflavin kinase/FAD synthetase [Bacteroidales bacterium]MBR5782572.1 bifunctional riboflavin kinase/FAD synthetase [Bacteroidales bacterium]
MKIYNNFSDFVKVPNAIVTIGTFDGVHLGHQAILKDMVKTAKEIGGETVVITFYPHPRQVLNINAANLRFITTQEEKLQLLEKSGIDNVVVVNFTKEFSRVSSEDFIRDYILKYINPVKLVIGYDHHFGNNRMGDFNLLNEMQEKYNFKVQRIEAHDVENIAVSSTKIRLSLKQGDVLRANALLGYHFSYIGKVISGNKIGRQIGYRTANIEVEREFRLIETPGVYATYVDYEGKEYKSMTYIGKKPTINDDEIENIEVHIFDFDGDLYDKEIKVRFVKRVRGEQKFESLDALKKQIQIDEKNIREIL